MRGVPDNNLVHISQPGREIGVVRDAFAAALEEGRIHSIIPHNSWVQPQVGLCKPAIKITLFTEVTLPKYGL